MRILLLGFGKVGGALCDLLQRTGAHVTLVGIATRTHGCLFRQEGLTRDMVRDFRKCRTSSARDGTIPGVLFCSTGELIADANYDVLVETTHSNLHTGEPALSFLRSGLERGAHVVTSNKGPMLKAYDELFAMALKKKCAFLHESVVLAGTPLFSLVRNGLPLGTVEAFEGVLNGTSNYILDLMESGSSFDEALRDAQRRGFTESDPLLDVEGWDSAAKAIVVARAFMGGGGLEFEDIRFEGIRQVTSQMLDEGRRSGGRVRLVSRVLKETGKVEIQVGPEILPMGHPLSSLSGIQCGAVFVSSHLGQLTITGPGTGAKHTAYGILRDLEAIAEGRWRVKKGGLWNGKIR